MNAWAGILTHGDGRSTKPRIAGVTMVIDTYQGRRETADLLETVGEYVDHWKLSFGTSALMDERVLRDKIAVLRSSNVLVYPGGTLTEYAILRGVWRAYLRRARELGFNGIEVSDGTIHLAPAERRDVIRAAIDLGFTVVAEVGKKDPRQQPTIEALAELALADLDSGAAWVTVEARESGLGVGVLNPDGTVRARDVDVIARALDGSQERLIWEAPLKQQQASFIRRFGPNVGLGNIPPRDVLGLEALRAGLRFETLRPLADRLEPDRFDGVVSLAERIARAAALRLPEA